MEISGILKNKIEEIVLDCDGDWEKAKQLMELCHARKVAEQAEADAKKRRNEIDQQFATLTEKTVRPRDFKGRKIRLLVSRGSVKNSYLLVTGALDSRALRSGEP